MFSTIPDDCRSPERTVLSTAAMDRFDDRTYWRLLDELARTHRPVRFADLERSAPDRYFILRHDIDYSPAAGLRLAREESKRGVQATYFLLVGCLYYSLLDPEYAGVPREIGELGHEIGLHYDVNTFVHLPRGRWEALLQSQARLLEDLAGVPVRAIAMHQPGLNNHDPFRVSTAGFVNAYDDAYFKEMPYVSDSCRAFRDAGWDLLTGPSRPDRFQLALHPINWAEADRGREEIFEGVHTTAARRLDTAKEVLLAQIARHEGVLQHESRIKGGSGS